MQIKVFFRIHLYLISLIILQACSDGSGTNTSSVDQQGTFIDSIVSGLRYESLSNSGFTDAQGNFRYREGELIRFFVGDIFIGESLGQEIITPIELVSGAIDETSTQVQNIIIFLQSIDIDGDESNGINITRLTNDAATGETVDFTLAAGTFEVDGALEILISDLTSVNGVSRSILPRIQVTAAFRANLIALFSGNYRGTFTGDDSGNWEVIIDNNGIITGQSTSITFGSEEVSGQVSSSGQTSIAGTTSSGVFSGVITRDGNISGTWLDDDGESGTFTGNRISDTPLPGTGDNDSVPDINSGSLTISGDDSGNIGVSFAPNLNPVIINDPDGPTPNVVLVSWFQNITSSNEFEARNLQVVYNNETGEVLSVGYFRATSLDINSDPTSFYTYSFSCEDNQQACLSISLDITEKQVIFNNFNIFANGDNDATGSISFNGTLSW